MLGLVKRVSNFLEGTFSLKSYDCRCLVFVSALHLQGSLLHYNQEWRLMYCSMLISLQMGSDFSGFRHDVSLPTPPGPSPFILIVLQVGEAPNSALLKAILKEVDLSVPR